MPLPTILFVKNHIFLQHNSLTMVPWALLSPSTPSIWQMTSACPTSERGGV